MTITITDVDEFERCVCIAHLRFIPCRKETLASPCKLSTDLFDTEIVDAYHQTVIHSLMAKRLIKFHHRGEQNDS